jgi:hypothetical protein
MGKFRPKTYFLGWIARVKAGDHATLEERQPTFHTQCCGNTRCAATASKSRAASTRSDQRSRRLVSDGHHGAARVGHAAAPQGISAVREAKRNSREPARAGSFFN